MRAHRLDHRSRRAVVAEVHAYPKEDAPGLLVFHHHEDDEGVLDVLARHALDPQRLLDRHGLGDHGVEVRGVGAKPTVWRAYGHESHVVAADIRHAPAHAPRA